MDGSRGTRARITHRQCRLPLPLAALAVVLTILAALPASAQEPPAQEPPAQDREQELEALQTRYRELQERYLALAEREAEREQRTTEMREAVAKLRAAVDDLVARQGELVGSLTALRERAARIDEAWLRELALRDAHRRDEHALPWEAPAGAVFHVIASRIEELVREGGHATVVVHEVVRIGERIVQRRRTLAYEHRDPIWVRVEATSRVLRADPAPPWIHLRLDRADGGGWQVAMAGEPGETWPLDPDGTVAEGDRALLRAIISERLRTWSELGIPRADVPAWIVAPHATPHGAVAGVLAVLEDAGVASPTFVGEPASPR